MGEGRRNSASGGEQLEEADLDQGVTVEAKSANS